MEFQSLRANQATFTINNKRFDSVIFKLKDFSFPDVSVTAIELDTPAGVPFHTSGSQIDFGSGGITFEVDNRLSNYSELLKWLKESREGLYNAIYNATVNFLSGPKTPLLAVNFTNVVPTNLGGFTLAMNSTDFVTTTFSFVYTDYFITAS